MFRNNSEELDYYTTIEGLSRRTEGLFVRLAESRFYALGGGQLTDVGTIDGHAVAEVEADENGLWHRVLKAQDFFVGRRVRVKVDKEERLEHSRQHTGQHLLSAILEDDFGIKTVAFHMGQEVSTIDTDGPVSEEVAEKVTEKFFSPSDKTRRYCNDPSPGRKSVITIFAKKFGWKAKSNSFKLMGMTYKPAAAPMWQRPRIYGFSFCEAEKNIRVGAD